MAVTRIQLGLFGTPWPLQHYMVPRALREAITELYGTDEFKGGPPQAPLCLIAALYGTQGFKGGPQRAPLCLIAALYGTQGFKGCMGALNHLMCHCLQRPFSRTNQKRPSLNSEFVWFPPTVAEGGVWLVGVLKLTSKVWWFSFSNSLIPSIW